MLKMADMLCRPWNIQVNRASQVAMNIKVFPEPYFNNRLSPFLPNMLFMEEQSVFISTFSPYEMDILAKIVLSRR